jgi:hypothetical protein
MWARLGNSFVLCLRGFAFYALGALKAHVQQVFVDVKGVRAIGVAALFWAVVCHA